MPARSEVTRVARREIYGNDTPGREFVPRNPIEGKSQPGVSERAAPFAVAALHNRPDSIGRFHGQYRFPAGLLCPLRAFSKHLLPESQSQHPFLPPSRDHPDPDLAVDLLPDGLVRSPEAAGRHQGILNALQWNHVRDGSADRRRFPRTKLHFCTWMAATGLVVRIPVYRNGSLYVTPGRVRLAPEGLLPRFSGDRRSEQ